MMYRRRELLRIWKSSSFDRVVIDVVSLVTPVGRGNRRASDIGRSIHDFKPLLSTYYHAVIGKHADRSIRVKRGGGRRRQPRPPQQVCTNVYRADSDAGRGLGDGAERSYV